jgi:hypothetical protein
MTEFNDTERESKVKQENVKAQMSNFNKPINPPAFPNDAVKDPFDKSGMSMRDYFAARAMQELMGTADIDDCCETAYKWADEMLKAREA